MNETYIINIGRQLGSGGHEIGEKLASKLNFAFYDKELINLASEKSGLCREFFEKADEEASQGFLGSLSTLHIPFINESSMPSINFLSNDGLFKIQSEVIEMLSSTKSCVFIGRCADYILRNKSNCVNFFITANREDRIKRICKEKNVDADSAASIIDKCDKRRAEYYNYYTSGHWGYASSYHLCINSSLFGIDGTVDFLEDFVKKELSITV